MLRIVRTLLFLNLLNMEKLITEMYLCLIDNNLIKDVSSF